MSEPDNVRNSILADVAGERRKRKIRGGGEREKRKIVMNNDGEGKRKRFYTSAITIDLDFDVVVNWFSRPLKYRAGRRRRSYRDWLILNRF
jgi:hypothetical protein